MMAFPLFNYGVNNYWREKAYLQHEGREEAPGAGISPLWTENEDGHTKYRPDDYVEDTARKTPFLPVWETKNVESVEDTIAR